MTPPKRTNKTSVKLSLHKSQLKKIDLLAGFYGLSRSAYICQCVDFAIHMSMSREIAELLRKNLMDADI